MAGEAGETRAEPKAVARLTNRFGEAGCAICRCLTLGAGVCRTALELHANESTAGGFELSYAHAGWPS
jgi:hypothetical protein